MEVLMNYREEIAYLIARLFLGCLFLFQGYDAVFNIKIKTVVDTYNNQFANKGIPKWLTSLGVWFTSLSELFGGLLLVFGFLSYPALYMLGLNIIVASIAFGISTPMWDMRFVFPRLLLILFLLLAPVAWNYFSLDHFLFTK